jgi:glycosyltransferase involved in cell wall biosynthesis
VNICTIIARNYAAHARVLAESHRAAHPDGSCTVLVIDDPGGYLDPGAEPFEILTIDDIGLPEPERMAAAYDVMELSTAVKPWLLRTLLQRDGVDAVAYLDPDIEVFAPLDEVARRAREHQVVLTPHFTQPLPRDGLKPGEEDILIAGSYNLGFIGLGDGPIAHELLDWWSERLENDCVNEPERGRFVDQRWIDLAPGLWPGIDVIRETTYNIAYWNLATRRLEENGGGYLVDGEPLRFFHFSGFDPREPERLSKHQTRVQVASNPALRRICDEYAGKLLENGFEQAVDWPYGWDTMANGVRIDRAARRVFREAAEIGTITQSVFSEEGAERFTAYLAENGGGGPSGSVANRYVRALWDSRPDLRRHFPDIDGESGPAFVDWLHAKAGELGIPREVLPEPTPNGGGGGRRRFGLRPRPGINLVGYLSSKRGVGEVARQLAAALEEAGTPLAQIDAPTVPEEIHDRLGGIAEERYPYDFDLICVNADMLPVVATALGSPFFERRGSAGLWFWEVSDFPRQWLKSFDYVDEVWVATEHVAEALRPLATTPVHTIRVPVEPGPADEATRAELGMPEGFCFFFLFDYRSVFRRKNPLGLVDAFCRAFEPGEGPSLVIKSICSDEFPAERAELAAAVADRPEIHLIEDTVSPGMKNAMIAGCDCYVSLHRSEGLGLTMAEAMYFGRPVIATAYSGNLDFMTEENSYLVPHEMIEIGRGAEPYPPDQQWAEPDLDRAAELMRRAFEDPEAANAMGARGAEDIRRTNSPAASARAVEERIKEVRHSRLIARLTSPTANRAGQLGGREYLEHLLDYAEPPGHGAAGKLRERAKRLYMRLLRPYAAHQQRINVASAEAVDELREVLVEALRMDAENEQALRELRRQVNPDENRP